MLITCVELTNIKSYRHAEIALHGGTTAIRGQNGAGKSTLVEAIGWALFDALPYSQQQFVREGEKWGQVTVTFVSAEDDREYQVVRRAGSGALWYVYDAELDHRPAEQKADVVDFLRRHLRIEGEIALEALFTDALGVPQGTLTADFLLTPANRKKKFDALLQVEEFTHAAERLRETRGYLQDALHAQELEIGRLERETQPLDLWRTELTESKQRERVLVESLSETQRQFVEALAQRDALAAREKEVKELERARDVARERHDAASARDTTARAHLREAEEAAAVCAETRDDHQAHEAAQAALTAARQRVAARDRVVRERAEIASALAAVARDVEHARQRLEAASAAERQVVELAPHVAEQQRLVALCEGLRGDVKRLDDARSALATREQEGEALRREIQEGRARIAQIETLRPEAALLAERRARVEELRAGLATRSEREHRLEAIAIALAPLPAAREEAARKEARATTNIEKLEPQKIWLERLPQLEADHQHLSGEIERLRATLTHHEESRAQSAGGQCPILLEPCQNVRQKGHAGLDVYFDSLITRDQRSLAALESQLHAIKPDLDHARKITLYYQKMDGYQEQREYYARHQAEVNAQIADLEAERAQIAASLADLGDATQLDTARQLMERSAEADRRLQQLPPLQEAVRANERRLETISADIEQVRQRTAELRGVPEQLSVAEQALAALDDPQARSTSAQSIARDKPAAEAEVRAREAAHGALVARERTAEEALQPFVGLDAEVARLDATLGATADGHARYLGHLQTAQRLPERRTALDATEREARQAAEAHLRAEAAHARARETFDPAALAQTSERVDALNRAQAQSTEELKHVRTGIDERESAIKRAEGFLDDLRAARTEYATLGELAQMLQLFRDTIKEAGPYVMQALLRQISTEANRIFGEILGDRAVQLAWQDDYEIVLRSGAQERHFAQLSGGEQMSAALAVRLALLRSLARLDIAFFDEPTQNMDDDRRTNLAEQLRRVHGFDQLIVISHDDTFEQGLDSVIHLEKRHGETVLVAEDTLVGA